MIGKLWGTALSACSAAPKVLFLLKNPPAFERVAKLGRDAATLFVDSPGCSGEGTLVADMASSLG